MDTDSFVFAIREHPCNPGQIEVVRRLLRRGHRTSVDRSSSSNMLGRAAFKVVVALALTFAAGFVDIVGYLGVYHLFAANMTGNTVHFANRLLQAHWTDAALPAAVILAFFLGSVLGRTLIEIGARNHIRSIASFTLLAEAILIVVVIVDPAPGAKGSLILLAAAMGLQTAATLTRIGPLTVHTTFVTGMLNKLAQLISHSLFLTYDLLRGRDRVRRVHRVSLRRSAFIFSIWLLYFAGAVAGTAGQGRFGLRVLVAPVALLAGAIVVDQWRPLSLREERDQAESAA